MSANVQIIEKNGKPEWAVIAYSEYLKLAEAAEICDDVHKFKKALAKGEEELIPEEFANRLIEGEDPIRVWREYRGLTQAQLAEKADISVPYLSQLENGEREGSTNVLKRIAKILSLTLDDLV